MNEDTALEIAFLEEQRKECEFAVRDAQWTIRHKRKEIRQIDSRLEVLNGKGEK